SPPSLPSGPAHWREMPPPPFPAAEPSPNSYPMLSEENPMSWEQRGSQQYYYRVRRSPNGHLVKTYVGTGPAAQRAAQEDNQKRALCQQERIAQQHIQSLETQLTALTHVVHTLVSATLVGQGFHQHQRGDWRRWRHLPKHHQQKGACTME